MTTIDHLLALLQANYRQTIDEDEARVYERELGHLPHDDLELAIRRAIRTRRFLPNVAELLEDLAAVRESRPGTQRAFTACSECHDGWITVPSREQDVLAGYDSNGKAIVARRPGAPATSRCVCWIAWRQSQGLQIPPHRPTVQVDRDRAIGGDDTWQRPAQSATVRRFEKRLAGSRS